MVIFSFDLDTDRCGIVIGGKLYKGDILFYPVIEYALGKYGQDHKKIYYDSRMIPSIAELVDYLGGTAIIHTKGHSKEKKTVEILMQNLAKEKGFASVEDFVKATGYKNYQMEYSLHPFITIDTGACRSCRPRQPPGGLASPPPVRPAAPLPALPGSPATSGPPPVAAPPDRGTGPPAASTSGVFAHACRGAEHTVLRSTAVS